MRCWSAARLDRSGGIGPGTVLTALLTAAVFAVPAVPAAAASGTRTDRSALSQTTAVVAQHVGVSGRTGLIPARTQDTQSAEGSANWIPLWSEDFSGAKMTPDCGAYAGVNERGANVWSPEQVRLSEGRLHIELERQKNRGKAFTSGGVGCWGRAQAYGRYEIRARVPQGAGLDSRIGLWPVNGGDGDWTGLEILAPGHETAYITNGWDNGLERANVLGGYSDAFHTYTIECAPDYTKISQDGRTLYRSSHAHTGARWLGFLINNGDKLTGVPGSAVRLPADLQIDHVRVWRYAATAVDDLTTGRGPVSAAAASRDNVRTAPVTPTMAVASDASFVAGSAAASVAVPQTEVLRGTATSNPSTATPQTGPSGGEPQPSASAGSEQGVVSDRVPDSQTPSVAAYTAQNLSGQGAEADLTFQAPDWGGFPWLIAALAAVVVIGSIRCSPYLAHIALRRSERSQRKTPPTHA